MKTIIITPETSVNSEIETCNQLLSSDLYRLHVRKPDTNEVNMKEYLSQLDSSYFHKISLHSHHHLVDELALGGKHFQSDQEVDATNCVSKSYHSTCAIESEAASLSYGFLSPIYDSISKTGYQSTFVKPEISQWMETNSRFPVFALGGIDVEHLNEVKSLGFAGVAVLGAIWSIDDAEKRLKKADQIINA